VLSQQTATTLLQQSLAALNGGQPITDVTLSGNARRIAGSDDESGSATFKALAAGAARMDLSLSMGQRSEIVNLTGPTPAGSWSGPDGVSHGMAYHNLLIDPSWFFPAFPISRGLSSSGYTAAYVAQETRNGQSVQHVQVQVWQVSTVQTPAGTPTMQHLSQMDFFLDATTLLPAAIAFNIHPDNNAGIDLPVEVQFSDYHAVSGAQVPFHIEKFLNNSLLLDLQFTSAQLNSGLSASLFNVQ